MTSDISNPRFPVGLRVLVVDDDPLCLRIVEKMLKRCQYEGAAKIFTRARVRSYLAKISTETGRKEARQTSAGEDEARGSAERAETRSTRWLRAARSCTRGRRGRRPPFRDRGIPRVSLVFSSTWRRVEHRCAFFVFKATTGIDGGLFFTRPPRVSSRRVASPLTSSIAPAVSLPPRPPSRPRPAVTTFTRGADALKTLREHRSDFDIVLSDVHMPDMDGFKLLEHIALELDVPVMMMSANCATDVVLRGIIHGAVDYLLKPVRIEELRNIWQHVVRRKRVEGGADGASAGSGEADAASEGSLEGSRGGAASPLGKKNAATAVTRKGRSAAGGSPGRSNGGVGVGDEAGKKRVRGRGARDDDAGGAGDAAEAARSARGPAPKPSRAVSSARGGGATRDATANAAKRIGARPATAMERRREAATAAETLRRLNF